MMGARERFVARLRESLISSVVVRASAYFSDMEEFLEMANGGSVWLLGDGTQQANPISGADLAVVCADALDSEEAELRVGGPDVLSHNDIAEAAFAAVGKPARIRHLPMGVARAILPLLRVSPRWHGVAEFMVTALSHEMVGVPHGHDHLVEFYRNRAVPQREAA